MARCPKCGVEFGPSPEQWIFGKFICQSCMPAQTEVTTPEAVQQRFITAVQIIERLSGALRECIDELYVPDVNCTCFSGHPPCSDCVDHSHAREILIYARKALLEAKLSGY